MIDCRAVTKSYASHSVLRDLSFVLEPGICAFLGPNGAGKSTLLRLLAGLKTPDTGSVLIGGRSYRDHAIKVRQKLGVVPEELGLFESLSVRENVLALGPIYGLSLRETEARTVSLLQLLALTNGQNTIVRKCSYGMRKKTALAMALLHKPNVLLLDEPFEGIDPVSSAIIQRLLRQLSGSGCTILLTSHILTVVQKIADRVLILSDGRISTDLASGFTAEELEELYFRTVNLTRMESLEWLSS